MTARLTQYVVTLGDGRQVLVDAWDTGEVEVSEREAAGEGWLPLVLTGGACVVVRP